MSRKRASDSNVAPFELDSVKSFRATDPATDILEYYKKYQVVVIKSTPVRNELKFEHIKKLFSGAKDVVNQTFSVEALQGQKGWTALAAEDIFGADDHPKGEWYASFISQSSKEGSKAASRAAVTKFRSQLPVTELLQATELPVLTRAASQVKYTQPVWVFVGHNRKTSALSTLRGRPEHVDSVDHDGTWHYQSQGTKVWYIRPAETPEWGDTVLSVTSTESSMPAKKQKGGEAGLLKEFADNLPRLKVVVEEEDVLIINTRVWWHQTRIPPTGKKDFSISYAIDFYCADLQLPGKATAVPAKEGSKKKGGERCAMPETTESSTADNEGESAEDDGDDDSTAQPYTNMDGLYASKPLKPGEVVFYESELPDCALPRSDNPNCEIVWLEDGSGALVASKNLQVGDWLTVAPSDSEDGSDGSEEGSEGSGDEECWEEDGFGGDENEGEGGSDSESGESEQE
jgi:hypothetical protein